MDIYLGMDADRRLVGGRLEFRPNITGFRAVEDFGLNAEPCVRTGPSQKVLGPLTTWAGPAIGGCAPRPGVIPRRRGVAMSDTSLERAAPMLSSRRQAFVVAQVASKISFPPGRQPLRVAAPNASAVCPARPGR